MLANGLQAVVNTAIGRAINNIFNPKENDAYVSHYPPSYGMREAAVIEHI